MTQELMSNKIVSIVQLLHNNHKRIVQEGQRGANSIKWGLVCNFMAS